MLFPYLRALGPYFRRYKNVLLGGYLWVILRSASALAIPWLLKRGIDRLTTNTATAQSLMVDGAWIFAAAVVSGLFLFGMRWSLIGLSRKIEYDVRNDYFSHLIHLSLPFFLRNRTGDLMARATNDLNAVRDVLGPGVMYSLNTSTVVLSSMVLMIQIDWILALAALAPVPILAFMTARFAREMHHRSLVVQDQYGELSNTAQENLAGIRVVQSYGQESHETAHFAAMSKTYLDRNMDLVRYRSAFTSTTSVLTGLGSVILLWLGGSRVIAGHVTLGELVAFMSYLSLLTWPFISIGWIISVIQRGEAAMKRMLETWELVPEVADGTRPVPEGPRTIRFEDVGFRYAGGPWALRHIDLEIPGGQTVAIVGRTAAGKSSLIQLLARLFDPEEGRITLDGIDIREFRLADLRALVGMVPQESFLFSDTLEQNLRFGRADASSEEIADAVERAQMTKEVEGFPRGLDTRIGERGITLSGGQRQRMSLARALLKDPDILILDDSLSAVDKVTEEQLLSAITETRKKQTLFLIAHRISTVRRADQILVIDQGAIVERGTHDELLAENGFYARMVQQQEIEEAWTESIEQADGERLQ